MNIQQLLKYSIVLAGLYGLIGCATIAGNTSYPVAVSSTPNAATFTITNEKGKAVHQGVTPATVTLKSGAGYFDGEKYAVKYSKDGFNNADSVVDSQLSGWYLGNFVFGGLLGLLVIDPVTGAMWKLPEGTSAILAPLNKDLLGK